MKPPKIVEQKGKGEKIWGSTGEVSDMTEQEKIET